MKVAVFISLIFALFVVQCTADIVIAVRMIHAISNSPNFSVYFDNTLLYENLDFGSVTQYASVTAGEYDVRVVQDNTGQVLYEIRNLLVSDEHTTLVCHGSLDKQDEFPFAITKLADDNDPDRAQARVRMYHTAAGAPDIDIRIDSQPIYINVDYTDLTEYQEVLEGTRVVSIVNTVTKENMITPTALPFDDETIVNLYFAGSSGNSDRLTLIVAIDIETGVRDPQSSSASVVQLSFFVIALISLLALF